MKYLVESKRDSQVDLSSLGKSLFKNRVYTSNPETDVPISVDKNNDGWDILSNPERLQRTYLFKDKKQVIYFFNELYKYQFDIDHHCKIVVDNLQVIVETFTHSFDGITEQDKKIKKIADELYTDVTYFDVE
jgi:pterin-4a-carbinolamine dehydratase